MLRHLLRLRIASRKSSSFQCCRHFPDFLIGFRCIDRIATVVQPALDRIAEYTGMKVSLIMGGPEPADRGELNVIRCVNSNLTSIALNPDTTCSLHSGSIKGPVKMNFVQSERAAYHSSVVPAFSAFLTKCYSKYLLL